MVRTRKQDYAGEVMQQEHLQVTQPSPAETVQKADPSKVDHTGKRNNSMVFTKFQQLPCELRMMIWEAAMTPRLVAVKPRPCPKDSDEARNHRNREIKLVRGIPALLAVNNEARHLALRHYTWRFTIDMTIKYKGSWESDERHRRARVVMSPDDTLGLFRCEQEYFFGCEQESFFGFKQESFFGFKQESFFGFKQEYWEEVWVSRFDVKIANDKRSPWRIHETTGAPEHGFKKVAILGDAVESNPHIVRALNITLWDLDSILHAESDELRSARSPHTKHKILLESAKLTPGYWESVDNSLLMDRNGQKLDILAYELAGGEKDAEDWREFLCLLSPPRLQSFF